VRLPHALLDVTVSTAAGYVGTKVMEPVSTRLYELQPAAAQAREDAVLPGPPYRVAADKITKALGVGLSEERLQRWSLALHYGMAVQWAPLYPLLRRRTRLPPSPRGWLPARR